MRTDLSEAADGCWFDSFSWPMAPSLWPLLVGRFSLWKIVSMLFHSSKTSSVSFVPTVCRECTGRAVVDRGHDDGPRQRVDVFLKTDI